MMTMDPSMTTIPLRKTTRDALKRLGRKDETYDQVLSRLIQAATQDSEDER